MRRTAAAAAALALALLLPLTVRAEGRATPFSLRDTEGRTFDLAEHLGKEVILLNFWATWCTPCAGEIPHLQRLYQAHREEGLLVVGVAMDGPATVANVGPKARSYGVTYPVLLDEETRVVGVYNPKRAAPLGVLIARDGRIAAVFESYAPGDEVLLEREILALLAERPPLRERLRWDVTATTIAGWHGDNQNDSGSGAFIDTGCDDDYGELFARWNLAAGRGRWSAALRLDGSLFVQEPAVGGACSASRLASRYVDDLRPEKLSVSYAGRLAGAALGASLGDAYFSAGRLGVSLRKDDELGIDTTLQGARAMLEGGRGSLVLAAGRVNIANIDEATGRSTSDTDDLIAAATGRVRVAGLWLGARAEAIAFHDTLALFAPDAVAYDDRWLQTGLVLDAPRLLPGLAVYLEGATQTRTSPGEATETGLGLYGAASYSRGRATLTLEGKAYGDLLRGHPRITYDGTREIAEFTGVQYTSLPTLERPLQIVEHEQRDIVGGRAGLAWKDSAALQLHLSYAAFRDGLEYPFNDGAPRSAAAWVHDPWGGLELRWNAQRSRLLLDVGHRLVVADGADTPVMSDGHLELDVAHAVSRRLVVELHGNALERSEATALGRASWREGTLQLGLRLRPRLSVAGMLDYSTQSAVSSRTLYPSLSAEWAFTPGTSLRLFLGASRGGLRCVSGVCREFAPFDGARLTFVLRL